MCPSRRTRARRVVVTLASLTILTSSLLPASAAAVATPGSLYSYDFRAPAPGTPVANQAAANSAVGLNLVGDWAKVDGAIHFDGDTVSKASVAWADYPSGTTVSIPATQAFGGAVLYRYTGPARATGCIGDSRNITQIGRYAAGASQLKMQLTGCGASSVAAYPECRVAGAHSASTVASIRGSQPVVLGDWHLMQCVKSPDAAGHTTIQLTNTRINAATGNSATTSSIQIPAAGVFATTSALSIANKYPMPAQGSNTDQFVGDIAKVAYCGGATTAAAATCLNTEISAPDASGPPSPVITTGDVTSLVSVPYQVLSSVDDTLPLGTTVVDRPGVDGVRTLVHTVTYTDGVETSRILKSDTVTTAPIDQVSRIGGAAVTGPVITTATVTQTQILPYQKITVNDPNMLIGTTQITQQGVDGLESIVYHVTYSDGVETSRSVVNRNVTTPPVNEITSVGTRSPVTEYVTNGSFETAMTGWSTATIVSQNSRVPGGFDRAYSVRSVNTSSLTAKHGIMSSPNWINGTGDKVTVPGRVYTAKAWVKPGAVGQKISLYVREINAGGTTVSSRTVTLTASNLDWQPLISAYTAVGAGNSVSLHVFATNSAPKVGFNADHVSLTTPH